MTRGKTTYMTKNRRAAIERAEANDDRTKCGLCDAPTVSSRGLCLGCYRWAERNHMTHKFTSPEKTRANPRAVVCCCATPVEELLALWNAVQCGRCGKPVIDR